MVGCPVAEAATAVGAAPRVARNGAFIAVNPAGPGAPGRSCCAGHLGDGRS